VCIHYLGYFKNKSQYELDFLINVSLCFGKKESPRSESVVVGAIKMIFFTVLLQISHLILLQYQ